MSLTILVVMIGALIVCVKVILPALDRPVKKSVSASGKTPVKGHDTAASRNKGRKPMRGSYAARDSLMNATESQVFHHIIANLPAGLTVSTKVRLADIVKATGATSGDRLSAFARIKARHVDFVIHDLRGVIYCIVEYDGPTHRQPKQMEADFFLNGVLHLAGLPLVRIDHTQEFTRGIQSVFDMLAQRGIYPRTQAAA